MFCFRIILINFDNIFVFFGGGPSHQQWDSKVYLKFYPPSRPRGCTKLFLINLINVGPTDPTKVFFVPTNSTSDSCLTVTSNNEYGSAPKDLDSRF